MKIGLISDTHNFLDPRVAELFAGVEHILHAGDIGQQKIILELERIAPVTVVLGNNDLGLPYAETEVTELAGQKFLVHHIVTPTSLTERLQRRVELAQPDWVIFGHTHEACDKTVGKVRFINPGYSGKPRFNQPRSVALLHLDRKVPRLEFVSLGS